MNYAVTWKPSAEAESAQIWLNATNRTAVTIAAHRLESSLAVGASDAGESRPGDFRRDAGLGR